MARTISEADRHFIRNLKRFLPLSALIAFPASAQWQITTFLSVDQHYTDNIALAPSGQEKADWVTQLRPGVSVAYNGPKLKFDATYTADLLYFASTGETTLRHQFSGGSGGASKTSWELVPDLLFLDISAGVRQENTSAFGQQARVLGPPQAQGLSPQLPGGSPAPAFGSGVGAPAISSPAPAFGTPAQSFGTQAQSINTTGDIATVVTAVASPYIRYAFGDEAVGLARYTYSLVNTGTGGDALGDSGANRFDARLESGPSYRRTRWHVAYFRDSVDSSNPGFIQNNAGVTQNNAAVNRFEQIYAGVQQLIASNLALTGTVGYEKNDYLTADGTTPKGAFWTAGVNWTPTPRTNFSASTGKRYFGTTQSLDFSHRMRRFYVNAGYREDITSTRGSLLQPTSFSTANILDPLFLPSIPDPVARQQAVQAFMAANSLPTNLIAPVQFFTNQIFLSKTWLAGVGLQGVRHSVLGNFYSITSENQQSAVPVAGAGDFSLSSTVKQTGVSGTWSWHLTSQDSTNFTLGYVRNEFPSIAQENDLTYFYWTYNHQFGPKLSGSFSFRRLNSESNLGGAGTYSENAVVGSLRMTF